MSTLGERSNTLALMDHTALLDTTIAALRDGPNPFLPVREQGRDYLYVRIDQIAQTLARTNAPSLPHPVQSTGKDPSCVTIHATPQQERAFSRSIKTLDRMLADRLAQAVEAKGTDAASYVTALCTPLSHLAAPRVTRLGFAYELNRHATLKRQRLTMDADTAAETDPLLRHHRLTLTVSVPEDFMGQLRDALVQLLDREHLGTETDDREEMLDILEDQVANTASPLHQVPNTPRGGTGGPCCTVRARAIHDCRRRWDDKYRACRAHGGVAPPPVDAGIGMGRLP